MSEYIFRFFVGVWLLFVLLRLRVLLTQVIVSSLSGWAQ